MNADDMPIDNQDNLNQKNCSKQGKKGSSYSQNGKYGIGHMSDGKIKGNAKVAGEIEEKNHNQSQKIVNEIHINPPAKSNFSKRQNNPASNPKTIKVFIKEGEKEASIEAPYSVENFKSLLGFLQQRFNDNSLEYNDIKKSCIKLILEGSEKTLENIAKSFESGELAPLLRERFNLELENAQLIDSDSYQKEDSNQDLGSIAEPLLDQDLEELEEFYVDGFYNLSFESRELKYSHSELINFNSYQKDRSQKLLVFTIAGDVSQADIDILKDALIDTSDDDEKIKKDEKSRFIEEIRTKDAVKRNLRGADLRGADLSSANLSDAVLYGADLSDANLSDANLIRTDLSGANLSGADLSSANLSSANLYGTYLRGADLRGADLSSANLSDAVLYGADLSDANLSDANLIRTDLSDADLSDADLRGANLSDANLSDADLKGSDLNGADLSGADLRNANVKNARFSNSRGISESLKQDLKARGAIFEDSPGDRFESLTPV